MKSSKEVWSEDTFSSTPPDGWQLGLLEDTFISTPTIKDMQLPRVLVGVESLPSKV